MGNNNEFIGSNFDDFLAEEGLLEEAETSAVKRVIAFQLEQTMRENHITRVEMAKKMHTSRTTVNRLFNPNNNSVTLGTLERAASAVGKKIKLELV